MSGISEADANYLKGVGKIMDRLLRGPGSEKGSTYYDSAIQGEYEFLRKKILELESDHKEAKK